MKQQIQFTFIHFRNPTNVISVKITNQDTKGDAKRPHFHKKRGRKFSILTTHTAATEPLHATLELHEWRGLSLTTFKVGPLFLYRKKGCKIEKKTVTSLSWSYIRSLHYRIREINKRQQPWQPCRDPWDENSILNIYWDPRPTSLASIKEIIIASELATEA